MTQTVLPGVGRPDAFDSTKHGIYRRFVNDDGFIEHAHWSRAIAEHLAVGTCRRCGHELTPLRPTAVGNNRTDYEATCRNDECEWTCNAPNGRVLGRSSRLTERRDKHGRGAGSSSHP